ncbi:asparagine synthase-related protein [Ornithinibacillus californiensis]|uniref:asparagine synthase-related protein n=1 Tax=Ornithinibacillus californiensis TaxID=161536 RepID=UPI00069E92A1|nr:asparagine synthase-related protein [Ornithinibacillus californiensis]
MHIYNKFKVSIGNYSRISNFPIEKEFYLGSFPIKISLINESSLASNNRFIVLARTIGDKATDILEKISSKGLNELETVQGSVAIIDKLEGTIILYRDPTGRIPLYWTIQNNVFYCSTSLKEIKNPNHDWNLDYFYKYLIGLGYVDSWEDTPFVNINRVPRGKLLTFNNEYKILSKKEVYFKLNLELEKKSEEDIYNLYREKLTQAIQKTKGESALFETSSGYDSTGLIFANSPLVTAKDQSLTLTFIGEDDIKHEAKKIADAYNLTWNTKSIDDYLPLSHLDYSYTSIPEEPTPDYFFYPWRIAVFEKAKELGLNSIISGYGGDELLTGNHSYISDLLRKLRFTSSWKTSLYLANVQKSRGLNAWWYLKSYGIYPLLNIKQKYPSPKDWNASIHQRFEVPPYVNDKAVLEGIKEHMENTSNKLKYKTKYITEMARDLNMTFLPFNVADIIGFEYGIEQNFPYLDKELIEFVLSLPFSFYTKDNFDKKLQRNAFRQYYPKYFQIGQEDFYKFTFLALEEYWNDIISNVVNGPLCKLGIISEEKVLLYLESWKCGKEVGLTRGLHALIGLSLWLKDITKNEEKVIEYI